MSEVTIGCQEIARRGKPLEYFTLAWNTLEGLIGLGAGFLAGSISLVGFGMDRAESMSAYLGILSNTFCNRCLFDICRNIDSCQQEIWERVMIFLGFRTGLRRGELSGIKWGDIDFETGQLHPRRSLVRQHVGKTKTEASKNIIPVDEHLLADLRAWRAETPYTENGDYVFASPKMKGKQPLWLDTVIKKAIKPAAAKAGIKLKGGTRCGTPIARS